MHASRPRALPLLLAALTATGPLGIDMYLPAIPQMAADFGTHEGAIMFSLMTFFFGLMLGQLAYGPLSDKFGRRPLIFIGMSIFVLGSIGCAQAPSLPALHAWRLLQGLGGSIGMVIAFAVIKDLFNGPAMGKMMSLVLAVLGLAPVLAPLVGNGLMAIDSWRLIFWALAVWGVLLALAIAVLLPESRSPEARAGFSLARIPQTYLSILRDRRFIPFAATLVVAQAGFFAYIAGSSTVFIRHYGLSPTAFSILFAVNAIGIVVAAIVNPKLHAAWGVQRTYRRANTAYAVVMLATLALFAAGVSHIAVLCAGLFLSVAMLGLIMPTGSQLAMAQQGPVAGTASALMGSLQFGAGAIISAMAGVLVASNAIALVQIMALCATVSAVMAWTLFPSKTQA